MHSPPGAMVIVQFIVSEERAKGCVSFKQAGLAWADKDDTVSAAVAINMFKKWFRIFPPWSVGRCLARETSDRVVELFQIDVAAARNAVRTAALHPPLSSDCRLFASAEYCDASGAGCPSALVLRTLCPVRISVSSSLLTATMNQKSSLREVPQFVSAVLTANTMAHFVIHGPVNTSRRRL